jgi:hypothetical protein
MHPIRICPRRGAAKVAAGGRNFGAYLGYNPLVDA